MKNTRKLPALIFIIVMILFATGISFASYFSKIVKKSNPVAMAEEDEEGESDDGEGEKDEDKDNDEDKEDEGEDKNDDDDKDDDNKRIKNTTKVENEDRK